MQKLIKIGHGGARGYEPENTIRSFQKAIAMGVDMVELDVYICKSGEAIVIHDETVNRTTNGTGYVTEKTFTELRELDAGQGEKIPTLEEVLALVNKKSDVNIELKGPNTAKPIADIINKYIAIKHWSDYNFLVSSFNHRELTKFKKILPQIKIGALFASIPFDYVKSAKELNVYSINLSRKFISQKLVDDAHQQDLKVFVFTVNDHDDIKRIKALGVDGIFSDFPDRL